MFHDFSRWVMFLCFQILAMNAGYDKWLEDFDPNSKYQFGEPHGDLRYYTPGISVFRDNLSPAKTEL